MSDRTPASLVLDQLWLLLQLLWLHTGWTAWKWAERKVKAVSVPTIVVLRLIRRGYLRKGGEARTLRFLDRWHSYDCYLHRLETGRLRRALYLSAVRLQEQTGSRINPL